MADLSTLDETVPGSSDAVSGGDDTIRDTRLAVKTSFGGTDAGTGTQTSEHYLKGFHKFPNGTTAARPAAGNAGRVYINTQTTTLERDSGSAWGILNCLTATTTTDTNTLLGASGYTVCASESVTVPANGRVLCIYTMQVTLAGGNRIFAQIARDSVEKALQYEDMVVNAAGSITVTLLETPGAGTYTYAIRGKTDSGAATCAVTMITLIV